MAGAVFKRAFLCPPNDVLSNRLARDALTPASGTASFEKDLPRHSCKAAAAAFLATEERENKVRPNKDEITSLLDGGDDNLCLEQCLAIDQARKQIESLSTVNDEDDIKQQADSRISRGKG